jgi:integrase/recombinase XerD
MLPVDGLEELKSQRHGKSRPLNPPEYQALLQHLPQRRYKVLLRLLTASGFRVSEALSVRTTDLHDGGLLVRKSNTKGAQSTREIPLPPELVEELRDLAGDSEYVFQSNLKQGAPLTRQAVDYVFRNTCRELNIQGWSLHGTRRFFITELAHKNVPLPVIQTAVGHSSLRSTTAYIEIQEHHIKNAVSLLWTAI